MRSNLAKVLLIVFVAVALVAALTACANDTPQNLGDAVLDSIEIEGGRSITMEEGERFDPSAYTLVAKLSDDSRIRVKMTASMFTEEELLRLNSAGDHTLTVSYSLNGITKSILFSVKVVAKVVEPTRYTVRFVMPTYDGVQYGRQLADAYVSTLTRPYIELNETDPTYLTVEWYTRADFTPNTQVSFPLLLTENNTVDGVYTIYGKAVDSRQINLRYYQRTVTQNDDVRAANPFYSDPNKYSYGDNHRTVSLENVIAANGSRTGYETPYLEIYNYQTENFERIGFSEDFRIENKYIEPSKLNDAEIDVTIDAVYEISKFTVLLEADKNGDGTIGDGEAFYLAIDGTWSAEPVGKSWFYFNSTLSASSIPTSSISELAVEGKNLSWTGYDLAGYDTIYVTGNLTLTGVYADITYDVLFYRAETGTLVTSFSVPHGATIGSQATDTKRLPELQVAEGYTFSWEYYVDASGVRYDISGDAIGEIVVRGPLKVYETRTANEYNTTFIFQRGNATPFEKNATFGFRDSVVFPTVVELKTALPEYNYDYYKFEWFYEPPVESSVAVDTEREVQRAADTVYYLRVSDMRRLSVSVVLTGADSLSGLDERQTFGPAYFETGSSQTSSVNINVSAFATKIKENLEVSALISEDGNPFSGTVVYFNNAFWSAYSDQLNAPSGASADGYYDYEFALEIECAVRTFNVAFYEVFSDAPEVLIEQTVVEFGSNPVVPASYDTSDRTVNGEVYSFYGWYSMPDDVSTYVSDAAFAAMQIKQSANFYAKWLSAKEGTFGVVYEDYNGYYAAVDYLGAATEVRIATEINGRAVNGIAADLFFWSDVGSEVTAVYLHSGIEFVEQGAFTPCNSLENIFVNGTGGKYISDNGVLYEDNGDGTKTLVKYPILKKIVTRAYPGMYTLLPGTTVIAAEAFNGYSGNFVDFGTSLTKIGERAFSDAKNLYEITLPTTLREVGSEAFKNAKSLITVNVEGGGSLINIEKFGEDVFEGTPWLVSSGATQIILGGVLLKATDTAASITLDDSVRVIAEAAFADCRETLETFIVGASSNLSIIGARAFERCNKLSRVEILSAGDVVSVDGTSFKTTASSLSVVVDAVKLEDYRRSAEWKAALGDTTSVIIAA